MLEPSDRKVLTNVTRWFTTCINQPQFLKVLGKITLCEKMVPVTPKTNAAVNGSPAGDSAAAAAANGQKVLSHKYISFFECVNNFLIFFNGFSFRPTKDRSPTEEGS